MLTAFEAFWKESRSATYLMDKIMGISNKLGVRGTAIYCVFTFIDRTMWLSVTSAGHLPLVIIREDDDVEWFPYRDSPAMGGMLGVQLRLPMAEDHTKLSSGDLIIIFTDGLELDRGEIAAVGLEHKEEDPSKIAEEIFSRAAVKARNDLLDDDATVLVIQVK
jgi:serine phosphatase RsbU (regulator of sigma subunit)